MNRNLALEAAPRSNAGASEATHEGRQYWKARLEYERKAGEKGPRPSATGESSPDFLRKVSEAVYRERTRHREENGAPGPLADVRWTTLGPSTDAGRVRDYAFTPDGSKLYVATANGGIWMLTRQGDDYGSPKNLTDNLALLTFGAVAVAPSNPNIVYAATGEQSPNSGNKVNGLGTIKSTDGGASWSFNTRQVNGGLSGLVPSFFSYDLNVNPNDPNDVLLGTANGIFRTRDGGETWNVVLPSTQEGTRQGCNFERDPRNPNVVWAGLWGGLAYTLDGGENWTPIFENLGEQLGVQANPIRSLVAMSKSNPDRLYWFVASQTPQGYSQLGVFRSDDGGQNFRAALGPPSGQGYPLIAGTQGWSFLGIAVDPTNPDLVIAVLPRRRRRDRVRTQLEQLLDGNRRRSLPVDGLRPDVHLEERRSRRKDVLLALPASDGQVPPLRRNPGQRDDAIERLERQGMEEDLLWRRVRHSRQLPESEHRLRHELQQLHEPGDRWRRR
ncbi:MAG: hypothetical protein L6R30_04560 [Thermoanaerobaculia bacterium]|nr:hypothetical protein [Thermoanaerobaculia bacterium]